MQRLKKIFGENYFSKSARMAKLWQFSQGHPKPAFSEKVQSGDQGKFFKNHPKSSRRLKDTKALWRQWHYPLITMHLNCKDWTRLWRKRRLRKCPNGQVMAILARSHKTRFLWKSAKGGPKETFKNRPKRSPPLKGPKALWRKWHSPLITMRLNSKDWTRLWRKRRLRKWSNGEVMVIFARSTNTRIFWKSAKVEPREIFQKWPKR